MDNQNVNKSDLSDKGSSFLIDFSHLTDEQKKMIIETIEKMDNVTSKENAGTDFQTVNA